ncbi:hypothetical protein Trydic_g11934 [Trypoxylus dichotomus]
MFIKFRVLFLALASSAIAGYSDSTANTNKQYFESLRKYHEQIAAHTISYSAATTDPYNQAQAQTSLNVPSRSGASQASNYAGYGFPGGFPAYAGYNVQTPGANAGFPGFATGFTTNFGPGQEGAAASASIGPQGVHQTAAVFPENPNIPNVDNRFGATPQGSGGGFYSVSTSSQSASSNLDGKPTSFHQATTTVNDNGKVTTYTVKKP